MSLQVKRKTYARSSQREEWGSEKNSGTISRFLFREGREWRRVLKRDYDLYLLLIPVIAFFVVFSYMPMYGLQIAF